MPDSWQAEVFLESGGRAQGSQSLFQTICVFVGVSSHSWVWDLDRMPGGLQSMGLLRVRHDFTFTFTFHFHALEKEMSTHSSVLAWRTPGTEEPGGLLSMGSHRVGHD